MIFTVLQALCYSLNTQTRNDINIPNTAFLLDPRVLVHRIMGHMTAFHESDSTSDLLSQVST
jgi:hypothetical protein